MHDDQTGKTDGWMWLLDDDDTPMLSDPFKDKREPAHTVHMGTSRVRTILLRWDGTKEEAPDLPSGMPYRTVQMPETGPMGQGKGGWASKLTDGSLVTQDAQGNWLYFDNRPVPFDPTAYEEADQHPVLVRERDTPSEDEIRSFLGSGDPSFTDTQSNARAHQQDQHPVGSVQEGGSFSVPWQDDEDTTDSASQSALS